MVRNKFQDIVPPSPRRSIRDIPVPEARRPRPAPASPRPVEMPPPPARPPVQTWEEFNDEPAGRRRYWPWLLGLLLLIILFFGFSYFFAKATVKVTPRSEEVSINQTLSADQKSTTSASSSSAIPYALIVLDKEGTADAPGTGDVSVSEKASGQIIVYNNYSSASQTLIATTRFQTPEGLVYRIDKDITVPGEKTVDGKTVAGSVEATVYADQPGEKYNVGLKDFTIPGFQGTPKASAFYARSKTPLAGGFIGTTKKVSDADLAAAHTKIEGSLGRELLEQARSQKPDNFILFDGALVTRFSPLPNGSSTSPGLVLVREKATSYAIVFDRDVLSSYLGTALGRDTSSSTLEGLDQLRFNLLDKANFPKASSTAISFTLQGNVNLVPNIDQEALKADLSGLSRSKVSSVLAKYPSIEKVDVVYRPLWLWSFPKKASDIEIEVVSP